ncbi:MAG: hypothetical protein GTO67_13910 [Gammaproteobacteria bacterium]|nr:hypothetical protein [Gammaproteobacteria bacterium]NIN39664.1 hypothetical protein [Gammaproteobacteria bacterium]NIO25221.1 hypothetical protein [Gammaproteobacteria bacterium]NIO65850.1 hypothetical protein [Gammaproteobacteria bacterium]NIP45714.1 hypothetical protein [Gammaproteobacteria bacterium]
MIRSISIALALLAGPATAGEIMDCFNDELDADSRYTRTEPEVLRITDADISALLERIRSHESRAVANAEAEPNILAGLRSQEHASD